MAKDGFKVNLHIYDLSQGLARALSIEFLRMAIDAFWHTGLVVYGKEYYFSRGIQQDSPGMTFYGIPVRVVELGVTQVPEDVFKLYLQEISPRFTAETYNLLTHNCNNFSNELQCSRYLEAVLKAGIVPETRPSYPFSAAASPATSVASSTQTKVAVNEQTTTKSVESKTSTKTSEKDSAKSAATESVKQPEVGDPLGEARSRVQDEITKEFDAIMATGTLNASEAATLATRRVMERHGRLDASVKQG